MELATAMASARAALDLLQLGVQARDDAKLKAATTELSARLFDITQKALLLQERNAALVEAHAVQVRRIAELEQKAMDRESYVLHEARRGAFVYAPRPGHHGADVPPHYLCQPCYDAGVKSMLRYAEGNEWTHGKWQCPAHQAHAIQDTQRTRY